MTMPTVVQALSNFVADYPDPAFFATTSERKPAGQLCAQVEALVNHPSLPAVKCLSPYIQALAANPLEDSISPGSIGQNFSRHQLNDLVMRLMVNQDPTPAHDALTVVLLTAAGPHLPVRTIEVCVIQAVERGAWSVLDQLMIQPAHLNVVMDRALSKGLASFATALGHYARQLDEPHHSAFMAQVGSRDDLTEARLAQYLPEAWAREQLKQLKQVPSGPSRPRRRN